MMLAKSSEQEKMKDKRVYPHVDLIPKVILLKLFLDMVTSSYVDNREFKITTTATATGTSLNKSFNEQNNGFARAL